ncbi:MAG: tRNA-specific adenosine deaminase [Clostridiales bacterium GWF2_36_10]|nr:MAG: tRNA-specific adenosine deaminase [Clostridiales bacterium GWF2_36_10]HAN20496.1 tRNA-specific adenosine deaminase [Clostridiales bacterium]
MDDIFFMSQAIKRAKKAASLGEVPIGAVIVKDNKIVSSGYNLREKKNNSLLHAEIIAIDRACKKLGVWRLEDCTLYVTLEPCPMCAGAIINSRIKRVVFGGYDKKAGVFGSVFNIADYAFNHKYEVTGGILEEECAGLLSDFFMQLRINKKGVRLL